jgi:hypothetical protein
MDWTAHLFTSSVSRCTTIDTEHHTRDSCQPQDHTQRANVRMLRRRWLCNRGTGLARFQHAGYIRRMNRCGSRNETLSASVTSIAKPCPQFAQPYLIFITIVEPIVPLTNCPIDPESSCCDTSWVL